MHLDNWNAFSTTTSDGYNSRFIKQLHVLEFILQVAKENSCKVVYAGDLFNRRLLVPTDVLHMTYEVLDYYDMTMYIVVGNHDMYDNNPAHTSLSVFRDLNNINIITQFCNVYVQPHVHLNLVPYGEPIPAASTKLPSQAYQILVAHYGINEAKLGPSNYRMESDLTVKQIKEYGYDLALFGHIHKAQALADNIIVLGSAMAHSFHEVDEEKYFYVFDCEERQLVKYETNAPKFLVHNINTEEELQGVNIKDGNYHRINVLTSKIKFDDVKNYTDTNVIISFSAQSQYTYEGEIESSESRNPKQEVEDYYDVLETDLEKPLLKKKAISIIEGV
jgi:DNA repair exonuclease SbcCD nuclease subunit